MPERTPGLLGIRVEAAVALTAESASVRGLGESNIGSGSVSANDRLARGDGSALLELTSSVLTSMCAAANGRFSSQSRRQRWHRCRVVGQGIHSSETQKLHKGGQH